MRAAPEAGAPGLGVAGRRPLVLAIDDDPHVIELLQEDLGEAGFAVIGATGGDEGIAKARELKPYAITLDILMPRKDGWQVLHELKSDPATRDIPVVILSIVDKHDLGYRLGAADYLLKPIDRAAILGTLDRLLGAGGRLLVVDDLIGQMLDGQPYRIDAAADGEAALEAVAAARPDLILLDLLMPGLDGLGVIERLKANPDTARIPIIVLTAKDLTADEREELSARVAAVIEKRALERESLIAELRAALAAYRQSTGVPA
jgi:CheY-like chemotaxis protein